MAGVYKASLFGVILSIFCLSSPKPAVGSDGQSDKGDSSIRIDIPVKLQKVDVVFNMNHLVLRGDMPLGMRYMDLMAKGFKESGTKCRIIAVFYNDGGHLTLNDKAYNSSRNVSTGNPYKGIIADLLAQGVEIEECAETMRAHKWTHDDLLPGVKVNQGAVWRIVQLSQQGFVQVQP